MRIRYVLVLAAFPVLLGACVFKPKANPDTATTSRGTPVDIAVLDNDTDPRDRDLTVLQATSSAKGSTSVNSNGTVRYTPNVDATGEDVFTYRIKNTRGRTSTAEVRVTIQEGQPEKLVATPVPAGSTDIPTTASPPRAVPMPKEATPVPLPVPSAGASITTLVVTFFTREDDKDAGETVQVTVRKGDQVVMQSVVGNTDAWPRQSDRTQEITLTPPVPGAEAGTLSLEVRKVPGLGAGESWIMQLDVQGRLSDGRTIALVPKSLPFRFGGGSSNNRTWALNAVPVPGR